MKRESPPSKRSVRWRGSRSIERVRSVVGKVINEQEYKEITLSPHHRYQLFQKIS